MEPYALQFPRPVRQSCTVDALTPYKSPFYLDDGNLWWQLDTDFNSTASHRTGSGRMWVTATNPALDRFTITNIGGSGSQFNPNVTDPPYEPEKAMMKGLEVSSEVPPGKIETVEMYFDNRTDTFVMPKYTWSCWDMDPERP
ncbi:hypothetical protein EJ04DRAFT_130416 [Polyplosphaeria fusca]|uniref:Uncharacterized protein n=1 Tax=Polyplosphaeria fusca TaxID=682080 RepID=A0A9P4R680_9PLEO|nr:hypothetical protein EJ04DRAFT_130416 [Polyplosphaeria fusca]